MPYTQSFLEEQLKQGERISIGWPWRLFTTSVIIFTAVGAVYLGIQFGYQNYMSSRIDKIDQDITRLNSSFSEEQSKNFMVFYSQLNNIQSVLSSRRLSSKFFDLLEKNTIKGIYCRSVNLDFKSSEARIEGVAPDFQTLSQQLEIFRQLPQITGTALENSKLSEKGGGMIFSIRLNFKL